MSGTKGAIPWSKMSAQERRLRSELNRLLSGCGILHGTLLLRRRVCGKPNCKCTRGELHEGLYLVVTERGKGRQLYVPKQWEQTVRQWIADYQKARGLMEDISRIHWEKVRNRRS